MYGLQNCRIKFEPNKMNYLLICYTFDNCTLEMSVLSDCFGEIGY